METIASILVVDDNPDLLENIGLTLETAGYQVLTAEDGIDALNVLESNIVDLILADIGMPHMNGYQLYERTRQNPEWLMIPFLFLTARAMDSDIRYGKELGVDDYLTKPIEPEDLLATVNGKLRRAQQLADSIGSNKSVGVSNKTDDDPLVVGKLRIDFKQHKAWLGEELLQLSAREFKLLGYLGKHADQVTSPQDLVKITHQLETDHVEAGSLLRPMIRSLRRKLGYSVGEAGCIENIRGVGYRLTTSKL
jgi:DNA-binding response OmpR family regulator